MRVGTWRKQPWEEKELSVGPWYDLAPGEVISTHTVTAADGDGNDKTSTILQGTYNTDTDVLFWVVGGDDETDYYVTVRITGDLGTKLEAEVLVKVREDQ